jgi:hypothetical protein
MFGGVEDPMSKVLAVGILEQDSFTIIITKMFLNIHCKAIWVKASAKQLNNKYKY